MAMTTSGLLSRLAPDACYWRQLF